VLWLPEMDYKLTVELSDAPWGFEGESGCLCVSVYLFMCGGVVVAELVSAD